MKYNGRDYDDMILRDYLAFERTILARKRTILSYIRTILSLFTVGVGMLSFFESALALYTGIAVLVISCVTFIFMITDLFKNKIWDSKHKELCWYDK